MDWFNNGIPSAIQQAKGKGIIFLVYITGVDDVSKKMDETWKSEAVASACKDSCVAIKLEAKSQECVQFSQIYPVVCVPSTFLIGPDGVPAEILGGHYEADDFVNKLTQVFQKKNAPSGSSTETSVPQKTEETPSGSSTANSGETSPVSVAEGVSTESETAKNPAKTEGGDTGSGTAKEEVPVQDEGKDTASGTADQEVDMQVKVQRAQDLIAKKREEKSKEAAEKARNEEIQRRQLGKDTAKLKQWQEEKNQQEMVSSWRKEKEEARIARERVKEQIARDRAERAAKFQKEKEERQELQEQKKKLKEEETAQSKARTEAIKRETARIQFRLPDGSNITETFASSETLGTAKIFLNAKVGESYGNYTLRTTFPKREFTSQDMSSTLLELELTPSAALVVIPGSRMSSSFLGGDFSSQNTNTEGASSGGVLMLILSPLILLWNFIYNLLFGTPRASSPPGDIPTQTARSSSSAPSHTESSSPSGARQEGSPGPTVRNRSKVLKSGLNSRQEGNVRRFTADQDDDDMTVYNGNSTQQM